MPAQRSAEDTDDHAAPGGSTREPKQLYCLGFDRDWDPLAVLQVWGATPLLM